MNINDKMVGKKNDEGKTKVGVMADFGLALTAVAEVGTFGIEKYKLRGGWAHVPDGLQRYDDAMWRHLLKKKYKSFDEESGLLHEAHFVWCAIAHLELLLRQLQEDTLDGNH